MQHQAHYHSNGVKAQLLSHSRRVVHLQNLTSNQEDDAKGEIPGGGWAISTAQWQHFS